MPVPKHTNSLGSAIGTVVLVCVGVRVAAEVIEPVFGLVIVVAGLLLIVRFLLRGSGGGFR